MMMIVVRITGERGWGLVVVLGAEVVSTSLVFMQHAQLGNW
jgi:hypothetical protein